MENFKEEGVLTLADIKRLYGEEQPEQRFRIDDYADELQMQIDVHRAELRRIRARRSTMVGRLVRLVRWAAEPKGNKPRSIPGAGLELAIIGLHVMIGLGHVVLYIRG